MTTDTRPWNIESSYYQSTRSQVRTQFDGLKLEKLKPIKAWGPKLLSYFGYAFLVGAAVLCLVVR